MRSYWPISVSVRFNTDGFDSGASAAGPAEEKALAYALVSRKPVLNLDPYTLAVSRIDKRADK